MLNEMKPAGSLFYRIVKRFFDVVFSLILLVPIGFIILISAIVIKIEDRGPVFYMAERTGRYGKTFRMFKLRTMKVNAPDIRLSDGSTYNGDDDPRVTKFGRFARKTSIDELPQVINIILNHMTFVGPRPDTPIGSAAYTEEEKTILRVKPGITGYNQALNRNSVLTKEKLKNDIYYVGHLSLLFDLKIVMMTIGTVLGRKNINRANEKLEDASILDEVNVKAGENESIEQITADMK